jgi:DegV family protein with EDD domain
MGNFAILTDSGCDLSAQLVEELGVQVVPLGFVMEGKSYQNHSDHRDMALEDFYRRLSEGALVSTNAVNVGQAEQALEGLLSGGQDVLVLAFSSGLSATCDSFRIAAEGLRERYPERKLAVVDSLCASLGQGMLVWQAARLRAAGRSLDEVARWAEENRQGQCHWFTVNDLFHLKRGGRVSAATAVVGTMLQIKPILHVDGEGHLVKVGTARGRKGALSELVNKVGAYAVGPEDQTMFISHSACEEDARWVADQIRSRYHTREIIVGDIGPVIGAHTGVGCVALFFTGRER